MWLLETLTYEISTSWVLMGELIGVIIFAAVFNNISSSFRQFAIGDSGFLISYFITFTIIFSNFTIMANLFSHTVETLSKLLKMLIPAYTLAVTLSGNLTVGVVFYEYFMIVVLVVNWICLTVVLPMIQYYLLLELLNNFSARPNISRLCESLYLLLSKSMKFLFVLFFGFHLLETMVVPSFDATKNAVFNRIVGMIPGVGSVVQSVAGTVVGSALMIKIPWELRPSSLSCCFWPCPSSNCCCTVCFICFCPFCWSRWPTSGSSGVSARRRKAAYCWCIPWGSRRPCSSSP